MSIQLLCLCLCLALALGAKAKASLGQQVVEITPASGKDVSMMTSSDGTKIITGGEFSDSMTFDKKRRGAIINGGLFTGNNVFNKRTPHHHHTKREAIMNPGLFSGNNLPPSTNKRRMTFSNNVISGSTMNELNTFEHKETNVNGGTFRGENNFAAGGSRAKKSHSLTNRRRKQPKRGAIINGGRFTGKNVFNKKKRRGAMIFGGTWTGNNTNNVIVHVVDKSNKSKRGAIINGGTFTGNNVFNKRSSVEPILPSDFNGIITLSNAVVWSEGSAGQSFKTDPPFMQHQYTYESPSEESGKKFLISSEIELKTKQDQRNVLVQAELKRRQSLAQAIKTMREGQATMRKGMDTIASMMPQKQKRSSSGVEGMDTMMKGMDTMTQGHATLEKGMATMMKNA